MRPWTHVEEDALRRLLAEMKRRKAAGWSVVLGARELVLRPPARELGKFAVLTRTPGGFWIHFFDRTRNRWAEGGRAVADTPDAAAELLAWAEALVAGRTG
jgi:hypothetical protein